jgi:hypothetical protein
MKGDTAFRPLPDFRDVLLDVFERLDGAYETNALVRSRRRPCFTCPKHEHAKLSLPPKTIPTSTLLLLLLLPNGGLLLNDALAPSLTFVHLFPFFSTQHPHTIMPPHHAVPDFTPGHTHHLFPLELDLEYLGTGRLARNPGLLDGGEERGDLRSDGID